MNKRQRKKNYKKTWKLIAWKFIEEWDIVYVKKYKLYKSK